jgi:hypothetical protein
MEDLITPQDEVRQEIAMAAARLIAEEGLDYPSAKNQAIKMVLGGQPFAKNRLPNDQDIQNEVRAYQALFQAASTAGTGRIAHHCRRIHGQNPDV